MTYRTRTYIAADWTNDYDAVERLHKWNDSEYWSLSFSDAHDLMQAYDSSLNCTIKKSLKSISIILVKKKIIDQPLVITKQIGQIENALRMSKSVFGSKKMRNIANRLLNAYLEFIREKKKKVSPKDVFHTITIQCSVHGGTKVGSLREYFSNFYINLF